MRARVIPLALSAVCMEALLLALRRLGDLRSHPVPAIELLLGTSVFYLIAIYLILKITRREQAWALPLIILVALLFRITVWPVFPAFSDDIYRYRWEGKLQAAGGDPYQSRPDDPPLTGLRDAAFARVALPDFKAGYGPLLEIEEALCYRAIAAVTSDPVKQVFWFKLPGAIFDLGIIAALMQLLAARGMPLARVAVYAWSPLPVFEYWVSGHNDSMAIALLLAALSFAITGRAVRASLLMGLAAAAKLWPALLLPLILTAPGLSLRKRVTSFGAALAAFAVCAWPYRGNVVENAEFLSGFLGGWRNNDSLFGLSLWLMGDLHRAKYLSFALLACWMIALMLMRLPMERGALAAIVGMLLLSANVHPWYLTWFLPLLAMQPSAALLLWIALAPLTYSVVINWLTLGEWNGSTSMRWYVYVPVFALLIGQSTMSKLYAKLSSSLYRSGGSGRAGPAPIGLGRPG